MKPSEAERTSRSLERLLEIMAALRDPQRGCPWDLQQTFETIAPYTIEEAYEVADAIERGDRSALREELGDLLFQVVYHAQLAREQGHFDFAAVAGAIGDKLIRRHPHVFGTTEIADAQAQSVAWEEHKAAERRAKAQAQDLLEDIPRALPALKRATKLGARAATAGFDWPDVQGVRAKVAEELSELVEELDGRGRQHALEEELGDLLFALTNLARHLGIDAETALRSANAKFQRRFAHIEARLAAQGKCVQDSPLSELEMLWNEAKNNPD